MTGDVLPTPSDASPEDADAGVPPAQDATDASSNNADADTTQVDASVGPVLLTPDLCDDPNNMALLMDALATSGEGPSYGTINTEQVLSMIQAPTEGPFYMVNLMRFRENALYPDGRETDLTGQEANQLYSPIEFLTAIGAKIVFAGDVSTSTSGVDPYWHQVAIVEYPCPISLFAMSADPEFQARAVHKDAGLEATIVMVTHLQPLEELGEVQTPFPGTAEDPSFELVRVHRYRQQALYPEGSNEPDRSGQEAMDLYGSNVQDVALQYGVYPKAHLKVQGVFIGDEREWDDVWIHAVPSNAAFEALSADPAVVAAQHHLEAALEDTYGLVTHPFFSSIPILGDTQP